MNVGKVKMVETVKGYEINENALGCEFFPFCYDCPFPDCIRGKKYNKETMSKYGKKLQEKKSFQDYLNDSCGEYQKELGKEIIK